MEVHILTEKTRQNDGVVLVLKRKRFIHWMIKCCDWIPLTNKCLVFVLFFDMRGIDEFFSGDRFPAETVLDR